MALDFPASPTIGDEFTGGGFTWTWSGSTWEKVAISGGSDEGTSPIFSTEFNGNSRIQQSLAAGKYFLTSYGSGTISVYTYSGADVEYITNVSLSTSGTNTILILPYAADGILVKSTGGAFGYLILRDWDESADAATMSLSAIDWTQSFSSSGFTFGATLNNSEYGIASNSLVRTTDGISWNTISNTPTSGGASVLGLSSANNRLFISKTGGAFLSTDGNSWEDSPSISSSGYNKSINFVNNIFVALNNNRVVFTSTDGFAWLRQSDISSIITNASYARIFYFNNEYYICSLQNIAISTDLITWSSKVFPDSESLLDITQVNATTFLAVSNNNKVYSTTNFTTWSSTAVGFTARAIASNGNGRAVVVGNANTIFYTNNSGSSWTTYSSVFNNASSTPDIKSVAYSSAQDRFGVSGVSSTSNHLSLWFSPTGPLSNSNWSQSTTLPGSFKRYGTGKTYYLNGSFYFYSDSSAGGGVRTTGVSGANFWLPYVTDIAFGNGIFVAANGTNVDRTTDARHYIPTKGATSGLSGRTLIGYDTNKYVSLNTTTNSSKIISSSSDGKLWNGLPRASIGTQAGFAISGTTLGVATSTGLFTSTDGLNFLRVSNLAYSDIKADPSNSNSFVACGTQAALFRINSSTGGYTQDTSNVDNNPGVDANFYSMAKSGSRFAFGTDSVGIYTGTLNNLVLAGSSNFGSNGRIVQANRNSGLYYAITNTGAIIEDSGSLFLSQTTRATFGSNFFDYSKMAVLNATTYVIYGGTSVARSTNSGTSWSQTNISLEIKAVFADNTNNRFILGTNDGNIYTSTDGLSFTLVKRISTARIIDIERFNNRFMALTSDGVIHYSTDGLNWGISDTASSSMNYINYKNTHIVTHSNTIQRSTDAITWSSEINPGVSTIQSYFIDPVSNDIIVSGSDGDARSTDGITWSFITPTVVPAGYGTKPTSVRITNYSNGKYLGTDTSSNMYISTNLSSWKSLNSSSGAGSPVDSFTTGSNYVIMGGSGASYSPISSTITV